MRKGKGAAEPGETWLLPDCEVNWKTRKLFFFENVKFDYAFIVKLNGRRWQQQRRRLLNNISISFVSLGFLRLAFLMALHGIQREFTMGCLIVDVSL